MKDKAAATAKGQVTRKTNQLAGARMSLPGHHTSREEMLRAEFVSDFKPANRIEMIWVVDIAYCVAGIELKRAQIAAFWHLMLQKTYQNISAADPMHNPRDSATPPPFDEVAYPTEHRAEMETQALSGFTAPLGTTMFESQAFGLLVGSLPPRDRAALRMLEQAMYDQTRERDRVINQIDRRRRESMRAAIEQAEARQRARVAAGAEEIGSDLEIEGADAEDEFQDIAVIGRGGECEADEPEDEFSVDQVTAEVDVPEECNASSGTAERGA